MARHGCLTASKLPVWLGFFCSKCSLLDKSVRDDGRLAQALQDVHGSFDASKGTVELNALQQYACAWGSNLEPNGLLTLLNAFPNLSPACSLSEHGFQQMRTWPDGFQPHAIAVSNLPPMGVSLDGLWQADPLGNSESTSGSSVVEVKCQFPFKAADGGLWTWDPFKQPGALVRADHFAQMQFQMLVSGCKQAYLVQFSVTKPSIIFRVPFDEQWCEAAIELISQVWAESRSENSVNVAAFTKKAQQFWKLTKSTLKQLNDKDSLISKEVTSSKNQTKTNHFE